MKYNPVISIIDFAQAVLENEWFVGFIRDDNDRIWSFNQFLRRDLSPRYAIHQSRLADWQSWGYKRLTQIEDIILIIKG